MGLGAVGLELNERVAGRNIGMSRIRRLGALLQFYVGITNITRHSLIPHNLLGFDNLLHCSTIQESPV